MLKHYPVGRVTLCNLALAHIIITLILWTAIHATYPAGWDTFPHYYLFTKFLELASQGHFSGYDLQWLAGYPVFKFYPPLAYAFLALPRWISFGAISPELSFSLGQFFLAHLFLLVSFEATRRIFGNRAASTSVLFSLLFLLENDVGRIVGLNAIYSMGIIPGFVGYVEVLLFLAALESRKKNCTVRGDLLLTFLFSLLLYTHILSALFAFYLFICSLFAKPKIPWGKFLAIVLVAATVSFPITYPLVFERGGASAVKVGTSIDPLVVLFRGLTSDEVNPTVEKLCLLWGDAHISIDFFYQFVRGIASLPWRSLFSLICLVVGCYRLLKVERSSFAWIFILSLLLLPREVLPSIFSLELHYYRFVPYIWLLAIPIFSHGLSYVGIWCDEAQSLRRRALCTCLIVSAAFLALINGYLQSRPLIAELTDYPLYRSTQEVVKYLKEFPPAGRVAIESPQELDTLGGSPHLLTTLLPLCCNIPVVPGLLVESSRSSSFINPSIVALSNHLQWGNNRLLEDLSFRFQSPESMVQRLALFGVDTLIVKSPRYIGYLAEVPQSVITLKLMIDPFVIYKINEPRPYLEKTEFRPFLFIRRGKLGFREFSEEWFKISEVFDRPVIYTEKPLSNIPEEEILQMGGVILSTLKITKSIFDEAKYWQSRGLEVVIHEEVKSFDGAQQTFDISATGRIITDVRTGAGKLQLRSVLTEKETPIRHILTPHRWENEHVEFSSVGGTIVNRTFAPSFKEKNTKRTIFEVTPSLMFIFAEGESKISYR